MAHSPSTEESMMDPNHILVAYATSASPRYSFTRALISYAITGFIPAINRINARYATNHLRPALICCSISKYTSEAYSYSHRMNVKSTYAKCPTAIKYFTIAQV